MGLKKKKKPTKSHKPVKGTGREEEVLGEGKEMRESVGGDSSEYTRMALSKKKIHKAMYG